MNNNETCGPDRNETDDVSARNDARTIFGLRAFAIGMLVVLNSAMLAAGCPELPPVSNCTPFTQRCDGDRPQVCSATQRWHTVGDVACSAVGGSCLVVDGGVAVCARPDSGTSVSDQ